MRWLPTASAHYSVGILLSCLRVQRGGGVVWHFGRHMTLPAWKLKAHRAFHLHDT